MRSNQIIEDYKLGISLDVSEETANFEFLYPPYETEPVGEKVRYLTVGISTVRASDGIRIHYDFERDGYSIEQPQQLAWSADGKVCDEKWTETAFVQSWHFEKEQEENEAKL